MFNSKEKKWYRLILPKVKGGKNFEIPYFSFACHYHTKDTSSLSLEEFMKIEELCTSETEKRLIRYSVIKMAGEKLHVSHENISNITKAVPVACDKGHCG